MRLADAQTAFRAGVAGEVVPPGLIAPVAAAGRLAIYRRHFQESFVRHIRGRFPTVEWMVGTDAMLPLAEQFIRQQAPAGPCLAEYGEAFGDFLAQFEPERPFLADVARLDWLLGMAAVAVDRPKLGIAALASFSPADLGDVRLQLQPGVFLVDLAWPVHTLVEIRLADGPAGAAPFVPRRTQLQVRGARGRFSMTVLNPGTAIFRSSLAARRSLGDAAYDALGAAADFNITGALATLFAEGLVTGITA